MRPRVDELLSQGAPKTQDELSHALWQATHGGQRRMVEYLAGLGADVNWTPDYAPDSPLDIAKMADTRREAVATWLRARRPFGSRSERGGAMTSSLVRRIHNPRQRTCGCASDCWCQTRRSAESYVGGFQRASSACPQGARIRRVEAGTSRRLVLVWRP